MSLFSSIGGALKSVLKSPLTSTVLTAFPATAPFGAALGAAQGISSAVSAARAPAISPMMAMPPPGGSNVSLMSSIGAGASAALKQFASGANTGSVGLSGFGIGPTGKVRLPGMPGQRRRRGRGITAVELRGFNKVNRLLHRVGMRPKAHHRSR